MIGRGGHSTIFMAKRPPSSAYDSSSSSSSSSSPFSHSWYLEPECVDDEKLFVFKVEDGAHPFCLLKKEHERICCFPVDSPCVTSLGFRPGLRDSTQPTQQGINVLILPYYRYSLYGWVRMVVDVCRRYQQERQQQQQQQQEQQQPQPQPTRSPGEADSVIEQPLHQSTATSESGSASYPSLLSDFTLSRIWIFLGCQMFQSLSLVQERNMLHCDVQDGNFMIQSPVPSGSVSDTRISTLMRNLSIPEHLFPHLRSQLVLCDFGIAKTATAVPTAKPLKEGTDMYWSAKVQSGGDHTYQDDAEAAW